MKLSEFLLKIAENSHSVQNEEGKFLPGNNGPYRDPETPVRNSAHWLIIFAKCYELFGEDKFKDKVYQLAEYLSSEETRPFGFSWWNRNKKGKDKCNGLIGQSWAFEALVEASELLDDDKYQLLAEEVFFQHPFNEELGLWDRIEIDGTNIGIDDTLNHQLWFAACSSLIKGKRQVEVNKRITIFMDKLTQNLTMLENGLIYHPIEWLWIQRLTTVKATVHRLVKSFLLAIRNCTFPQYIPVKEIIYKTQYYKSIGYHSFNMYAFAMLKMTMPNHQFWNSEIFNRTVTYMLTDEYKKELNNNIFGYPYNPPGFEVPFSISVLNPIDFARLVEFTQMWIYEQLKRSYDSKSEMMSKNTQDSLTLTARIYELARLSSDIFYNVTLKI